MMRIVLFIFAVGIAIDAATVPNVIQKSPPWFFFPDGNGNPCLALGEAWTPKYKRDVDIDLSKVHFYLWSRENPSNYDTLIFNDTQSVTASHFRTNRTTKIYVHGYADDGLTSLAIRNKDAYLAIDDCNVISVDWKDLAEAPWYYSAVDNTLPVGQRTAAMIDFLVSLGANASSFHPIGFSLGAHVVGVAGAVFKSGTISRITGLDPARPGFDNKPMSERLDTSDADFLDIVHTNGGSLWSGCLAFPGPMGHVDFYPNGGVHQPGCGNRFSDLIHSCSHLKAPLFFSMSVALAPTTKACPCDSWDDFQAGMCNCGDNYTLMGEFCPTSARGTYYLKIDVPSRRHLLMRA